MTPSRSFKELEALNYWRASRQAREGEYRAQGYNDLYGIATNTDWPLLAKMSANALLSPDVAAMA
ncbi:MULTISPECIES: hypothetical protein [Paracoccus]|uniref:hypothetical protein n=1 Tax=Paracoccus TaxID=265 RepID=UPI0023F53AB0|nr:MULTISPECIES: hypothetical protein [Paracoccus]